MTNEITPTSRLHPLLTLDARPTAFGLDVSKAALLVIDMQNDFGAEGGMFERAGIDISAIQKAVPPTAQVLVAARACGIPIVYLKMGFKTDLSDVGPLDSPNHMRHQLMGLGAMAKAPNGDESRVLIRDTWNTGILPALAPQAGDIVLYKHRFSGFFETELHGLLQQRGIKQLIVTGCTTSICVESTIRDAMFRDYSCVLLEDCTAEPLGKNLPRSNHEASLLTIQVLLGWVSTSDKFIQSMR
ncbi:cysteine hydrolase [Paucibacter sp. TC2R-5]|uniref:cysteine hydrolase family protein n=1 Tax=Paucibacter sp. TC2R-5 TaxID=2893555 RepID=UPI0021E38A1B|nr:cysteine hydrolase [Paucibacter sp. TC2R-5]MCV2361243.1 cysteine hydrolase [Paucibacter sp. TC2R-5]